jgi:serine/threonine protein kinase
LVGLTIGEYKVEKQLGKGQFGTVYLATNQKGLKFALKLLDLHEIANEGSQRVRLIRERLAVSEPKLMMLCESPNLIKCYDIYENADLKVLVMEFCEGRTLEDELKSKKKI